MTCRIKYSDDNIGLACCNQQITYLMAFIKHIVLGDNIRKEFYENQPARKTQTDRA